jgi:hypothetical protein
VIRYVVDASVAIKWFFQTARDEDDLEPAVALLRAHQDGEALFISAAALHCGSDRGAGQKYTSRRRQGRRKRPARS